MENLLIDPREPEVYHLPPTQWALLLGWVPYRFPGIDRKLACRFHGIGGLPPRLPNVHYFVGGAPYRFPGLDGGSAYRFHGIGGLPPPLPSGRHYLGGTPCRFHGIDREPAYRFQKSEVYHVS